MSNRIGHLQKHRRYAAKKKEALVACGYRYQTLALAGDVVSFLERVKEDYGFSNKAEAINWLIRQTMQVGVIKERP